MKAAYRDLLKHSGIYFIGQVLGRLASFVLLPVYTRCLTPADYGCIAVLDLAANLLTLLIGANVASAVARYHFEAKDEAARDRVWWSGFIYQAAAATVILLPLWALKDYAATFLLGREELGASAFVALTLPTIWVNILGALPEVHLRVRKQSTLFVYVSLGRLLFNMVLNIVLLVVFEMGVSGILAGNLITGVLYALALCFLFQRKRGACVVDLAILRRLLAFALPLLGTAILQMIMNQGDRYFLRVFSGMQEVGLYSIAFSLVQAVNTLVMLPFGQIWNVVMYEIAEHPDSQAFYGKVFRIYSGFIMVLLFGVALGSRLIIAILTSPEYAPAAEIVPLLCLAFWVFSLQQFFNLPAMLAKRTQLLLPGSIIACVLSVLGNLVLVPRLNALGAAITLLTAFTFYNFVNHAVARRLKPVPLPIKGSLLAALALTGLYLAFDAFVPRGRLGDWTSYVGPIAVWAGPALLFGAYALHEWRRIRERSPAQAPKEPTPVA